MKNEVRIMEEGDNRKIRDFKDLSAWQVAHQLVLLIYKISRGFPKEELYGLTNQIRRAVISIVSNIAEGFNRRSYVEKARFYEIALGSVGEVQCQLEVAKDLGYIGSKDYQELIAVSIDVHKLINGLVKGARERSHGS